jgi:Arc/MetJ family transcription regulator
MPHAALLQIEFDEDKIAELQLMLGSPCRTKKEIVNAALTLLKWAATERRAGKVIASVDETADAYKVLSMSILDKVATSAGRSTTPS